MNITKYLFFLAIISEGAAVAVPIPQDTHARLGLSLYGNSAQSADSQSRIAGAEVEAGIRLPLHETVEFRVTGGLQIETGVSRARWAGDYAPRQIQRLREAQVNWVPLEGLSLIAGAIDQQRWSSPLLLQRQSFPALYESYQRRFGDFIVGIEAQQAIPSDTSSLQPFGNWSQRMPAFYFERLRAQYLASEQTRFSVLASHYSFNDLASPGAFQSQFFGNTISGTAATDARYAYGFRGFEIGAGAKTRWGKFSPELIASFLTNSLAPSDRGQGWRIEVSTRWENSPRFALTPKAELFRMASDVVPGFYNDRVFGHNNRNGIGVSVVAEWPLSGIQGQARWIHAGVLSPHPYQSQLDWLQLQLSTQYDLL